MSLVPLCNPIVISFVLLSLGISRAVAGDAAVCPRPVSGSTVTLPPEARLSNGRLHVALAFRGETDDDGLKRYCYIDGNGREAPTLRVSPGDEVTLDLTNELAVSPAAEPLMHRHAEDSSPCSGEVMTARLHQSSFPWSGDSARLSPGRCDSYFNSTVELYISVSFQNPRRSAAGPLLVSSASPRLQRESGAGRSVGRIDRGGN